ncbi:MAG: alanine racemase [Spirochaetia bacterium]|nr:alanine racemase [Spirochaetia bacterium]
MPVTYARINISNFLHNLKEIKKITGRKICMAAKADCYGHGAKVLVKAAEKSGLVDAAGIADVNEGIRLRQVGVKLPLLIYRGCITEGLDAVVEYDIQPFVSCIEYAKAVEKAAEKADKKVKVHLKVDSGMSRAGCRWEDAFPLARYIDASPYLELAGACTHFAVSDTLDDVDVTDTRKQIDNFNRAIDSIKGAGITIPVIHCAASGAILMYPETWFDMVRPGILVYGYAPSRECEGKLDLKPVMDLVSHVLQVKDIRKGEKVSYGFTWQAPEDTTIAVIGAGYADGYNRLLSNKGRVFINGRCYPLAGRVCMDQFMVDLGSNPYGVKPDDEVILFGEEEGAMDAFEAADICGTISYELLCNINPRVPRIYVE